MRRILDTIGARLASEPRIRAAYVFGSRGRSEARATSDLDIAVLTDGTLEVDDQLRLHANVSALSPECTVDLVLLDSAPPLLRYEVVSGGRRLFARDDEAADAAERRWIMEYYDTEHLRTTQQQIQRELAR